MLAPLQADSRIRMPESEEDGELLPQRLHSLLCQCAQTTRMNNYKYVALSFGGRCYAAKDDKAVEVFSEDVSTWPGYCYNARMGPCSKEDAYDCYAERNAVYLYVVAGAVPTGIESPLMSNTCQQGYRKKGCFQEIYSRSLMDTALVNDRDPTSSAYQGQVLDWVKFEESLKNLTCRCAKKAKDDGFLFFSIRFYGECHGGKDSKLFEKLVADQSKRSTECVDGQYNPCNNTMDDECAGKAWADYIYEVQS